MSTIIRTPLLFTPSVTNQTYAIHLSQASSFHRLRELTQFLFKTHPTDVSVLNELAYGFAAVGDFISVHAVREQLQALNQLEGLADFARVDFSAHFAEKARKRNVSSAHIAERFDTALGVVHQQGFTPLTSGFILDEWDTTASLRFVVAGTTQQRTHLAGCIADTIVGQYDDDLGDLITFGVTPPRETAYAV
jgi:hypothetical protein